MLIKSTVSIWIFCLDYPLTKVGYYPYSYCIAISFSLGLLIFPLYLGAAVLRA